MNNDFEQFSIKIQIKKTFDNQICKNEIYIKSFF